MALTTLLFDLDGTLLPLNLDEFMKGYFELLLPNLRQFGDAKSMKARIWQATEAMMANEDPSVTNEDAFKSAFFAQSDISESEIWPIFAQFYAITFGKLQVLTRPTNISREICRTAADKGYELVLATNPIFPEAAIRHRMQWAEIDDIPFALVTSMERMHFCKPSPKYYVEILDKLDRSPFECLMFGNDVQEDGVAGKIGMQTYLVTDCLINREVGHLEFTYRGSLVDALQFVRALPPAVVSS
ncbi:MAG: HAD family hydrolase [Alicyclobacillus sp.]|nr:HAD family hydrolase [Alicyclobacillus sp.]